MKCSLIIIYCFFISFSSLAQTQKITESNLLKEFKKIDSSTPTGPYSSHGDPELIENINNLFIEKFKHFIDKYPISISQSFKSFEKEGLGVITSEDGLFRIYCWNTGLGGTQQEYANIFQYKVGTKTHSNAVESDKDGVKAPFYLNIFTLKDQAKTYYLATYEAQMDISEYDSGVQIFVIEKDSLNQNVNLIKTKSGFHNRLQYSFIWHNEHPDYASFDEKSRILKLPVILENGTANDNYITYKFTGKYFEKVKN